MLNRTKNNPRFGEIWMCNVNDIGGSVQSGYRPVFILSNDMNNTYSPTVNIIPITSKSKKNLPIHVELKDYTEYGLRTPSTMLIEQIRTVPTYTLEKCIGKISNPKVLKQICYAISIQFQVFSVAS